MASSSGSNGRMADNMLYFSSENATGQSATEESAIHKIMGSRWG